MKNAQTQALVSLDQHIAAQAPVVAETPKSHKKDRPAVTKEVTLQGPVAAKQVPFRIIEDVRPTAGGRLFAFTQAWLEVSGMQDGKGFDKDQARLLAGNTAIAYHMKLGNFEMQKDGLHLSIKGSNFFKARVLDNKVDPKQVEGFKAIFTTGKMDGDLVKNQHFIKAM